MVRIHSAGLDPSSPSLALSASLASQPVQLALASPRLARLALASYPVVPGQEHLEPAHRLPFLPSSFLEERDAFGTIAILSCYHPTIL
jgi:hypothetical protein